jgi:hypothetical protein
MLRSILTRFWNQKSKLVLLCCAVLSMLLFSKLVRKYIWSYKNVIATTSATKSANTLLQIIIESYNSSHSLSKLKMYEVSNLDENLGLKDRHGIDLAVIPPSTVILNGFEVIAALNEEKIVLVSHKGNHFEQLRDISNATFNIVNVNNYDEGVLRKLGDFLESKILPDRTVYVLFLNPFSSTSHKIFKTKLQRLREKLDIIEIDLAELASYSFLFFSSAIKKGELSIRPLLPDEDIDTVSAFTYLVARTSVSEETVYDVLTFLNASKKLIFEKVSRDALINIEGISESKNIAFHHGYKKFLYGENEWFFQKNSDLIYLLDVILTGVFSFIYSNYKKRKTKVDKPYTEVVQFFKDLEGDLYEAISSEDRDKILRAKKRLSEFIIHKSKKKDILLNSLIGLMVLTNITNTLLKKD